MKVALIAFNYAEYCIRLANGLAEQAEVMLLLPRAIAQPHLRLAAPAVRLEMFDKPRLRQVFAQRRTLRDLIGRIRRFQPDVLHFQQGYLWFNLILPLLGDLPLVITVHDPRYHAGDVGVDRAIQPLVNRGFLRADQLIVHAEQCRQALLKLLPVRAEDVQVIPHVQVGDVPAKTADIAEEEDSILFFGRIWRYKGLAYLIRAEPLITAHRPQARIVIAGEGEDFAPYRRMMIHPERFSVTNRYIADDEAPGFFCRASLVVLPYIDASQSGVVPMAYTYGKPVVATTVGGLPEIVEDGVTGILVPPRDERALAEAVLTLLEDPLRRRHMGRMGRQKIETECSPAVVARATLAAYARAVEACASRSGMHLADGTNLVRS
ncbi:MAG: glycosyltransferase family 4 protein [Anaerolineae bacterium]|nr:glycosyltransferase family 4 protein [Anaerolineae bacterium]